MFLFDVPAGWLALLNPFWPLLNVLLLSGLAMAGGLTYWRPAYGVCAIALALPLYLARARLGGLPTTYLELMILIVAAAWAARMQRSGERFSAPTPLVAPLLGWLAAGTLALLWSPDLRAAAGLWKSYLIEPIIVFVMARHVLRTEADYRRVTLALGISAALVAAAAIWQWFSGVGIAESMWVVPNARRVTVHYTSPNAVGLYLVPILALLAGWIMDRGRNRTDRFVGGTIVMLGLLAVATTQSSGAWLGIAAALFVLGWFQLGRWRTAVLAVATIVVLVAVPTFRTRVISEFQHQAWQNRADLWRGTWQYLTSSPTHFLFGAGIAGFAAVHESFRNPRQVEPLIYPHNIALNFWVEYGLLGLMAASWIAARLWRITGRALRQHRNGIQLGAWAGLGAMVAHGLFDVPFFKNDLAVLTWLLIALALPIANGINGRPSEQLTRTQTPPFLRKERG